MTRGRSSAQHSGTRSSRDGHGHDANGDDEREYVITMIVMLIMIIIMLFCVLNKMAYRGI